MALILHLETATTVCSVALALNGDLLSFQELDSGFTHAENLHGFIQSVLEDAGVGIKQLEAVAVSKGPGSYTGLRIGVSAAKGLGYALGIPVIGLDTLQVMSRRAANVQKEEGIYCPMIDARRMEVYTAKYGKNLKQLAPVEALIIDLNSLGKFQGADPVYFFGDGMPKCRELLRTLPKAAFIDGIAPSAKDMCQLAFTKFIAREFEDLAYFEPFYLKDFLITQKRF